MIDEQLEFLISQYADGSLPESERARVDLHLLGNSEARALLEEYRGLDASLKSSLPLPAVNWNRLASHLSAHVAGAVAEQRENQGKTEAATILGRIGTFGQLAIAACIVLAVSGAALWTQMKPTTEATRIAVNPAPPLTTAPQADPPPVVPAAVVVVRGPALEPPATASAPVVVVSVGPSPAVTQNWRIAEGVVTGPSRAIWIASSYDAAQDTQRLPY